jgi:hypothetical protein
MHKDCIVVQKQYKDFNFLQTVDVVQWVKNRNYILLTILSTLLGCEIHNLSASYFVFLAFEIEHMYSLLKRHVVLPFSFGKNLMSYHFSTNKNVCALNSACGPAGSYGTIVNWISYNSKECVHVPDKNDVLTFFDNNQVLARIWRVHYDAKAILSAITTVVHIFPFKPSFLQWNSALSPRKWLFEDSFSIPCQSILSMYTSASSTFRVFRERFINDRLSHIFQEQRADVTGFVDEVGDLLSRRKKQKTEGGSLTSRVKEDVYNFLSEHHNGPPTIVIGNPIPKNPCSYESVKEVLINIKNDVGVPEKRSWSLVGCDGLPYLIASKVIRENPELQDLLLQPGLGHWEMNMAKGILIIIQFSFV